MNGRPRRNKNYKAAAPMETVQKAREILLKCDLFLCERDYRFDQAGVACARIWLGDEDVADFNIGTNGKGMNARYALASAYGEMMERLENYSLFPTRQRKLALDQLGYVFAPDEVYLNGKEAETACRSVIRKMFRLQETEVSAFLSECLEEETMAFAPYYSVTDGKAELLPIELIWKCCGSNGMCAGNTPKEALIQGLSEVFERYAIRLIFEKNIPLPLIPESWFEGTNVLDRLNVLRNNGWQFEIRDCSCGINLPVIGLKLVKPSGEFAFHLGADPSPITALERCLSELFQGNEADNSRRYHKSAIGKRPPEEAPVVEQRKYWDHYMQNIVSGFGAWPETVFDDSVSFIGFRHPVTESDEDDLAYMLQLLKENRMDLYVRNNSSLGFPAFQLFVPGVSEVKFIFDADRYKDIRSWSKLCRQWRILHDFGRAGKEQASELLSSLMDVERSYYTNPFKPLEWFPYGSLPDGLLKTSYGFAAAVAAKAENFRLSEDLISQLLSQEESSKLPALRMKVIREYIHLRAQGYTAKQAKEKLVPDYGEKAVIASEEMILNPGWPKILLWEDVAGSPLGAMLRRQAVPYIIMKDLAPDQNKTGRFFEDD